MVQWSFGRSVHGPVIDELDAPWQQFTDTLHDAAQVPNDPADKLEDYWIAPMLRHSGATRREIADVRHLAAWIGLDIDHGHATLNDLRVKLHGTPCVIYSTANATPDDMRWRVLIHLDRQFSVAEHARVWRWYAARFELDTQTKNSNRIFFVPRKWTNGVNAFYVIDGKPPSVDSILAMVPEEETTSQPVTQRTYGTAGGGGMLRPAPAGAVIVTPHMLTNACSSKPGGRLWRLMCAAAKRYRLEGWELTDLELAQAAEAASAIFAPGVKRTGIVREAQRAIDWVIGMGFEPQTPIERMRSRILFDNQRKLQLRNPTI